MILKKIEEAITPQTSAILGVHVYGIPCDTVAIDKIAKKYNLKVIYDAAHIFDANTSDLLLQGDISMLSFHATKLFHTVEGGALICKDVGLKKRLELLRNFGIQDTENVIESGINGKINEFQSLMGLLNLEDIDDEIENRSKVRSVYNESFKNIAQITTYDDKVVSESYYPIRVRSSNRKGRNELHSFLQERGVYSRKYFYPLCSNYPFFKDLKSADQSNLPVANLCTEELLCLPFYSSISDSEISSIINYINDFFKYD